MSSFRKPHTVKRKNADGEYVDGIWQAATETDIYIMASVQPATAQDMQSLPEGRRKAGSFILYTDTALKTVDTENPDTIDLFGDTYEVITSKPWQNDVINHYECIVSKIDA